DVVRDVAEDVPPRTRGRPLERPLVPDAATVPERLRVDGVAREDSLAHEDQRARVDCASAAERGDVPGDARVLQRDRAVDIHHETAGDRGVVAPDRGLVDRGRPADLETTTFACALCVVADGGAGHGEGAEAPDPGDPLSGDIAADGAAHDRERAAVVVDAAAEITGAIVGDVAAQDGGGPGRVDAARGEIPTV